MIVRSLEDLINTDRDVFWGNGQSRRFLIEKDGMGYTLTDTLVEAGTTSLLEYTNHLEACYCIEGEGEVRIAPEGPVFTLKPGTMYALNQHDKHYLYAKAKLRLICVFLPALKGKERHKLTGTSSSCY